MERLTYDIAKEYSRELSEIGEILDKLKNNRVMELNGVGQDGHLSTNAVKLEEKLNELLTKIQNGREGREAEIYKWF